MNKNIRRSVVALATAFACLALMGSPASAYDITGEITGGTVTLINSTGTSTDTIPLATGGGTLGTNCVSNIQSQLTGSTTSVTSWGISVLQTVGRFKLGTTWYVAELTRTASTTGTISSITTTTAALNTATLTLAANIYTATNQSDTSTDCSHGTTRTCRFANVLLGIQGIYLGNIHLSQVSHTVTLTATGTLGTTTPPCNAPFTTYNGGTVTVTGLTFHITAVAP